MQICPNCSHEAEDGALACRSCGAQLAPPRQSSAAATHELATASPDEARASADAAGRPGKLFWAAAALGLSFAGAARLIPDQVWMTWVVRPVLAVLAREHAMAALLLIRYVLPAFLFYVLLRSGRAECWLRPNAWVHRLLWIANALVAIWLVSRLLAALVPGGGGTYVVQTFAPFVGIPAMLIYLAALVWLIARSLRPRAEWLARQPFTAREATAFIGLAAVAIAPAVPLVAWKLLQ